MAEEQLRDQDIDVLDDEDEVSDLSSSPSIPDGEIDFDFVYALHTFLATVEGLQQPTARPCASLIIPRPGDLTKGRYFGAP